jgi:prepilin-type processing-associated H-X9-DG protein
MYLEDWDGVFQYGEGWPPLGGNWGWINAIRQYNKTLDLWHCPSANVNITYTSGGGAACYPDGFYYWGCANTSDIKNPDKFIHFGEAIGTGKIPFDRNRKPFSGTQPQDPVTGDADPTADSQGDGRVYHDANGNWVKTLDKSVSMAVAEDRATTHMWEMHWPGRHGGGNVIVFLDGHAKWFKDWAWGQMTMRRRGPYPQGDRLNNSGSDFPEP